jgi:hypothetical protein
MSNLLLSIFKWVVKVTFDIFDMLMMSHFHIGNYHENVWQVIVNKLRSCLMAVSLGKWDIMSKPNSMTKAAFVRCRTFLFNPVSH